MRIAFLIIAFTIAMFRVQGQYEQMANDYQNPKIYEIGNIKVEGARYSDDQALISISGLSVGSTVKIPGQEIPRAIKKIFDLHLFENVEVLIDNVIGETVFLIIRVKERSRYSRHGYTGVKKNKHEDLNELVRNYLIKGSVVTENDKTNAANAIKGFFVEKGFLDTEVTVEELKDERRPNNVRLVFDIDQGDKVKIKEIAFEGNELLTDKKLRKQMKNTKQKSALFKKSVLIEDDYEEDKGAIIYYANNVGFRDARILNDSIYRDEKGEVHLLIDMYEGPRYYFGNITWKGNTIYDDDALQRILGIEKGDVYNKELLDTRLSYNAIDGRDVTSVYMDNGYLFFRIDPIEKAIRGDTIDLEMRIFEGPQATIDRVEIQGNTKTHEHVIRRELRTKPSKKFSRSDIIRSQRELVNLGYFNPENLGINTPVNPEKGTVDIIYSLEEKSSDQLELSAGWGGGRVLGTLGVAFNNFSLRNFFSKETWQPVPQGDGQRLSLRGQTNGQFFRSLNMSFTEPWLGGKKPNSFSLGMFITQFFYDPQNEVTPNKFTMYQATAGLSTRLRWPDDNFILSGNITFTNYQLDEWQQGTFRLPDGSALQNGNYYNQSFKVTFARNSVNSPLFPTDGTLISLSSEFTLPISLMFGGDKDYAELTPQERFRWLEYHKWRFDFDWYTTLVGKLVFKASAKMGFLGFYNRDIGVGPFERFQLQQNPLQGNNFNQQFTGLDLFMLRGYEDFNIANNEFPSPILNKMNMELRFPVSTNPQSTIYILTFLEGARTFNRFRDFTPFDLQRSFGAGVRVFLPMFGLLGFDYGIGLDPVNGQQPEGIQGGVFNFYLGFEPD
ncbi:MAG TPA: outer membrane protein assembly factor BamA [Saprospiraceae bacterium]|nr:outer membrane protein assembly factor BamA [Saprospiraceae bacterium]